MAEKIFNTRILNKIATLEAWNNSTLKIKEGEICIATVAASAGAGLTEPVCMIKIGTAEEKTFSELPWAFHAKASDVLNACKSEDALKSFVNSVIAEAGIASDEAMQELANKVTTAEGKITTLEGTVGNAESGLVKDVAANTAAIAAVRGLVGDTAVATQIANAIAELKLGETYAAKVHTHAIADVTGLNDAIADAKKAGTDANTALETYKETNDAAVKANSDAITAIKDDENIDSFADVVAELAKKQNTGDYATKAEAQGYADAKDEAIAAAQKAGDDAQGDLDAYKESNDAAVGGLTQRVTTAEGEINTLKGLVGDTAVATQIKTAVDAEAAIARAAEKANSDAIGVLNGNSSVDGSVDKKITDAINTFATQLSDDETVNTYKELINYAATHGQEFTELVGEVDANAKAIETLNGGAEVVGSVDKKIADAIAAENLSQYATDAELTGVDNRLKDVEAAVGETGSVATAIEDAVTEVKGYTDEEIKKLAEGTVTDNTTAIDALEALVGDTAVATQISTAIDTALKVDGADKYALASALTAAIEQHATDKKDLEDAIALKANDADLHAIAKSGNVNDLVQTEGDVLIFNCGGAE